MEQYQQERRAKILALHAPQQNKPPEDTRAEADREREKLESPDDLVREFSNFAEQFADRMKMSHGFADAFAEMSQTQISRVWDSVATVNMAIIKFSIEVKALQAERQSQPR